MPTQVPQTATPRNRQRLVEDASNDQSLPIGFDIGNGASKLYCGLGMVLQESYLLYLPEPATFANQGYVEYIEGDRSDLIGKQWIGGINAYYSSPSGIYRVTDSTDGKVDLALQLLLSSLTQFNIQGHWELNVVASVHDGKVFGRAIAQSLAGTHRVRLMGRDATITINVQKVLEEGAGSAYSLRTEYDFTNALLLDLGNGTSIATAFNGLQITHRDYAPDAGVEKLIDAIATADSIRAYLKRPADRHLIRSGIERGDFSYGTQFPGWDFKSAYTAALPEWFNQSLKPFVKSAETRVPAATAIVAVGGGACLPGIASLLSKKGIAVPPQPRWANAKGLYEISLRLTSKV